MRVLPLLTLLGMALVPLGARSQQPAWPAYPVWILPIPVATPGGLSVLPFPTPFWFWGVPLGTMPTQAVGQPPPLQRSPAQAVPARAGIPPGAPAEAAPVPAQAGQPSTLPVPERMPKSAPGLQSAAIRPPVEAQSAGEQPGGGAPSATAQPAATSPVPPLPEAGPEQAPATPTPTGAASRHPPAGPEKPRPPVVTTAPAPWPEVETVVLPGSQAWPAPPPARPQAVRPARKVLPARTGKPAPPPPETPVKKPRKLCWKDGRLDVCP